MAVQKTVANRYVQLTDMGLERLTTIRRRLGKSVEDIANDRDTPSANTVKRALRKGPIFVGTLERIWSYLQRSAAEKKQTLPYLVDGEDYVYVESEPSPEPNTSENRELESVPSAPLAPVTPITRGWISRQVPYSNRLFTGRRDVLDQLHAGFAASSPGLDSDPQAITGLGGMGKTQTAIAYIYAYRREYSRIFWVNAETVQSMNDGLADIAEELQLLDSAQATNQQALKKIHDWFRDESDWLLVLDNADDIAVLAPHFPRHHGGRLLLTTRARNTVKWAAPTALARFGAEEGALLLLRRAGEIGINQILSSASPNTVQAAVALSEELGGLPLALSQAGAFLAETTSSAIEYLAKYRQSGIELLDSISDTDHAPVTITFHLAREQMAKRSLYGQAAIEMLNQCAFLMPDAIPEVIFIGKGGNEHYEETCAAVTSYSLLTRNPENKTVSIHRLVQQAIRSAMTAEERRSWSVRTVRAVAHATPDFEFEDWQLCARLLPHWRLCEEYIREGNIETEEAGYLLYQAGRYLRVQALYEEAESFLQQAIAIAEKVSGTIHITTADYLDELGCLYRDIDRREGAEQLQTRSLEITESVSGSESPATASKLHNLALLYYSEMKLPEAEALFTRSLAIREKNPGKDESLMAATLTQLGGVYRGLNAPEKAEQCHRRALETYERILPPDHVDIAVTCNNLALILIQLEHYKEADTLLLRSLRISEQVRGKDHPETGTVLWTYAWSQWKQRYNEEAEESFQRAISIYTRNFGRDHSRLTRLIAHYNEFRSDQE